MSTLGGRAGFLRKVMGCFSGIYLVYALIIYFLADEFIQAFLAGKIAGLPGGYDL